MHGAMRSIGTDVGKKRFPLLLLGCNKLPGVSEPDVGTESVYRLRLGIMEIGAVELGIVPIIGGLAHTASAMPHHASVRLPAIEVDSLVVSEMDDAIRAVGRHAYRERRDRPGAVLDGTKCLWSLPQEFPRGQHR